jgi:hypothetical protein
MDKNLREIEAYLSGSLSEQETIQFEQEMKSRPEIKEQLMELDVVLRCIDRMGLKEDIKKAYASLLVKRVLWRILFIGVLLLLSYLAYSKWGKDSVLSYHPRELELARIKGDFNTGEIAASQQRFQEKKAGRIEATTGGNVASSEKYKGKEVVTQYFQITTNRDTLFYGKEGTALLFKAQSINTEQASVIVSLKEFYRADDIIFSPLSTETVNHNLLESGGMVYVEVKDTTGQVLGLKEGHAYKIAFPERDEKKEMQLYKGVEKEDKVSWLLTEQIAPIEDKLEEEGKLPSPTNETVVLFYAHGGEAPNFLDHEGSVLDCVLKELRYPLWAVEKEEKGRISVSYRVSKEGEVLEYRIVRAREVSPRFYDYLGQTILSLPQHRPYKLQGKVAEVAGYTLDVPIDARNKKGYTDKQIKEYRDSLLAARKAERVLGEEAIQAKSREKMTNQLQETSLNEKGNLLNELDYYVFSSTGFGWLNCDRSLNLPLCKNFKVLGLEGEEGIRLRMIVHRSKTIIAPREVENPFYFPNAPRGEKVSLFAFQVKNGKVYTAMEEVLVSDQHPRLSLKETTLKGMEAYTQQMNKIYEQ